MKLTSHLHQVLRLGIHGAMPLPHMLSWHGALLSIGMTSLLFIYSSAYLSHFIRFLNVQCVCIPCILMHTSLQTNKIKKHKKENVCTHNVQHAKTMGYTWHSLYFNLLAMSGYSVQSTKTEIMKISQQFNSVPSEINM
jgi:hypothetical protein